MIKKKGTNTIDFILLLVFYYSLTSKESKDLHIINNEILVHLIHHLAFIIYFKESKSKINFSIYGGSNNDFPSSTLRDKNLSTYNFELVNIYLKRLNKYNIFFFQFNL